MMETSSDVAVFSAKPEVHKRTSGCLWLLPDNSLCVERRTTLGVVRGLGEGGEWEDYVILSAGPAALQVSSYPGLRSRC